MEEKVKVVDIELNSDEEITNEDLSSMALDFSITEEELMEEITKERELSKKLIGDQSMIGQKIYSFIEKTKGPIQMNALISAVSILVIIIIGNLLASKTEVFYHDNMLIESGFKIIATFVMLLSMIILGTEIASIVYAYKQLSSLDQILDKTSDGFKMYFSLGGDRVFGDFKVEDVSFSVVMKDGKLLAIVTESYTWEAEEDIYE